jgi:NAD+ synthase (glutamine-hydrolysing)
MKIALAQLNYHIGNFESNTAKIIDHIHKAKQQGADLVVFAELCVCGYPSRDFLEFDEFIGLCEESAMKIAAACTDMACIIGLPLPNHKAEGKALSNSAYFIENGKVKAIVNKALLPNYDVFDEYRYFEPSVEFDCIDFKGHRIALTICEDLWNTIENPLYVTRPMDSLIKQQPDVMINIAASPFSYRHDEERIAILSDNAKRYNMPLFYVNHVGAQTELIFDGGSLVFDNTGKLIDEMPSFEESIAYYVLGKDAQVKLEQPSTLKPERASDIEQIHQAILLGIRDYFYKSGFSRAILGLSGGIDSAVVCALAAEALGPENVMAVLLPSRFSTDHSLKDAEDLVKTLGCKHETIAIKSVTEAFETALQPQFNNLPFNIAEENIQSRSRAVLLMAMCNKFGYILLNTSNKSEAAVGYGTMYGDMCGGISVIGDVYKTQVFQLARHINREREIIPENSIVKPPSAELRPDQKDSDSLPEYDILDKIIAEYVEGRCSSAEIIRMGRRMPIVGKYLS